MAEFILFSRIKNGLLLTIRSKAIQKNYTLDWEPIPKTNGESRSSLYVKLTPEPTKVVFPAPVQTRSIASLPIA